MGLPDGQRSKQSPLVAAGDSRALVIAVWAVVRPKVKPESRISGTGSAEKIDGHGRSCGFVLSGAKCRSSGAIWGTPVKASHSFLGHTSAPCQSWPWVQADKLLQSPWASRPGWLQVALSQRQSTAAGAHPAVFAFSMVLATVVLLG